MNYDLIKQNYERGLWTAAMVALAVKKGVISAEQFEEITGEAYNDIGGSSVLFSGGSMPK